MADNKKYYYLKLKDDFFETDSMIVLESMADGYKYANILMKLYLRSLKYEGKLMFNERIPYNSTILAQVTRHSVGDIERAINIFKELDLIEVLDNGAIFITDIQNFIGKSTTEADRKREYRLRIEKEKNGQTLKTNDQELLDKPTVKEEVKEIEDNQWEKDFEEWWKLYDKKIEKKNSKTKFKRLHKKYGYDRIKKGTELYLQTVTNKQYQKHPTTFLNGEVFNDTDGLKDIAAQNRFGNSDNYLNDKEKSQYGDLPI